MSIEAMKLALEELEGCYVTFYEDEDIAEAITALRQAIEQAQKQEPDKYAMDIECTNCGTKQSGILTVNTTSPQRQPLTENEIKHFWYEACQTNLELTSQLIVHLARNIEAAHGIKE